MKNRDWNVYQFFVEPSQIQDKKVIITGGDVNHIKNVLRLKPGEEIAVKNGVDGKEYRCGIEEFTQEQVICSLRFVREEGVELPSKIYLFQGIPKADKMELIVQKAVELGVFEIIPTAVKRCVVKLDEKKAHEGKPLAGHCGGGGKTVQKRDDPRGERAHEHEARQWLTRRSWT